MQVLKFFGGLVLALLLQLVGVAIVPSFARYFDPFLVFVVIVAARRPPMAAMIAGSLAGLTLDTLTGGLYGLNGFALTLIGFLVARAAQTLSFHRPAALGVVGFVAALVHHGTLLLLQLVLSPARLVEPSLLVVALRSAIVGLAVPVAVILFTRGSIAFDRWRRDRRSRLSWGV